MNPEEVLLAKALSINATIGRGLTDKFLSLFFALYLSALSSERQAAGQSRFNGSRTSQRGCVACCRDRHPELNKYRAGTIEEDRESTSTPELVARWYALLSLMCFDYKFFSSRHVWNMD